MIKGSKVWIALMAQEEFTSQTPEAVMEAMRPYVEAMPEVLGQELLEKKVGLGSLFEAKVAFIRYCLENAYLEKTTEAIHEDEFFFMGGPENAVAMMRASLEQLLPLFSEIAADVATFLESRGITEQQALSNPQFGFNAENLVAMQKGKLTIGGLLLSQPLVIIKNTD